MGRLIGVQTVDQFGNDLRKRLLNHLPIRDKHRAARERVRDPRTLAA